MMALRSKMPTTEQPGSPPIMGNWPGAHSDLIGSRWAAREPEQNEWDLVEIVGVVEGSEVVGTELALRSVTAFGPVVSADRESFLETYKLTDELGERIDALSARIAQLVAS